MNKDSGNSIEDSPCYGRQSTSPDEYVVKVFEVVLSKTHLAV
jgi:hypothetical protein